MKQLRWVQRHYKYAEMEVGKVYGIRCLVGIKEFPNNLSDRELTWEYIDLLSPALERKTEIETVNRYAYLIIPELEED